MYNDNDNYDYNDNDDVMLDFYFQYLSKAISVLNKKWQTVTLNKWTCTSPSSEWTLVGWTFGLQKFNYPLHIVL